MPELSELPEPFIRLVVGAAADRDTAPTTALRNRRGEILAAIGEAGNALGYARVPFTLTASAVEVVRALPRPPMSATNAQERRDWAEKAVAAYREQLAANAT
ncbi:hypothetical protein GS982_20450 [Rhodococcus hoagii]|nr:hypothetical protein [Prescottella equi]NKZ84566.1 hypothetical protein [Prescottella equi]